MMSEVRHGHRSWSRWASRLGAATMALALVLAIPAAAATAQAAGAAQDRVARAVVEPSQSSRADPLWLVRTGAGVRIDSATTTSARASGRLSNGLNAQLVQARRPEGQLGQWVVGVLLSILVVLWIVLVAVVVRAHMRFAQSARPSPSDDGMRGA